MKLKASQTLEKKGVHITFDKSASGFMLDTFKDKFPLTCIACGKEVNEKNLGGIIGKKGFIHNNIVCLIQMQEKGSLMIEKVKKDHHSELDPYDYGCKINALIDATKALQKRVEGLERHEHFKNNGAMFIPYKETS